MPKTWFRVHANGPASLLANRKVQSLKPNQFKWLINLWCVACPHDGVVPPLADVAWILHSDVVLLRKVIAELKNLSLIDEVDGTYVIHDWQEHQYQTDDSKERVRRFREKKRLTVTDCVTVGVTESVTEKTVTVTGCNGASRAGARSVSVSVSDSASLNGHKVLENLEDEFESLYKLSCKKRDRGLAERYFCEAAVDPAKRSMIVRRWPLWNQTKAWRWKEGAAASTMAQWILDQGFRYDPPETDKEDWEIA